MSINSEISSAFKVVEVCISSVEKSTLIVRRLFKFFKILFYF